MRVKLRALRAELGKILGDVSNAPVTVTKRGEDVAVIISTQDFAELQRLRSVYTSVTAERRHRLAFHQ
jgi:prevent-host-death family protein